MVILRAEPRSVNPSRDTLLTVKDVARRLAVQPRTIWRWVASGKFPRPIHVTSLCVRWRPEAVEAWLEELMEQRFTVVA